MEITFKSNNCIGIKVNDIGKAEEFYSKVRALALLKEQRICLPLIQDILLYMSNKAKIISRRFRHLRLMICKKPKKYLLENGCILIQGGNKYFGFKDPFGNIYDIIEK